MASISNGESGSSVRIKLNASLAITAFISVTGNVNLDTMASDISSAKTKTDFITVSTNVNLNTIATDTATNNAKVSNATHTGDVTGATVLTIANGVVTIAKLSATGTPNSSTFLRGDGTWATPGGGGGGDLLAANNLSDLASIPTARTNLGLAIGTNVQAYNASLAAIAAGTWTGANSITTLGTVTTGTLSTGAVIGGVTMTLGSDATGDVYYRNSGGVLTRLAAGTNGHVLTLSGGLPTWAAGGGGGSSTLDAITAAAGNATINNANNVIEWQWNSMVTTAGMTFTSSSTGLTNTAFTNVADAIIGIKATGASAASNVVSKALYVSNIKTGTGSTNYGIYATTESGTGIANAAIVSVGYQGGGLQFGAASSTAGAIWSWNVTPTTSNYVLTADGTTTNINGSTAVNLRIGASARLVANNSGVCIGNANGVYGKLSLTDTVIASGLYGMVSLGANAFQGTAAGHFGRPAGTASTSSNTNGTWLAINAPSGSTADIFNFQTAGNSLLRLSSADSTLSLNVALKADVKASAIFQIDSTTKGFLPPRMTGTQAEAISSPATGLLVFSTDGSGSTITSLGWWGYSGSAWVKLN